MGTYGPKPTSAPAGAITLHASDNVSSIVNAAPDGATFYFEPGVYRGVSLTPKSGQTFIGAEGAILNGSAVLTGFTQQGNLWVIGGQTQQGTRQAADDATRAGYPETVFVDNTPLKPVNALSKVVSGTFYFDYAADKIYIADNPTGHTIEAGKLADAFHGNAQNVTVQNLVVEKYDSPVQHGAIQGGQSWTIQDNEVRLNYGVGIKVSDNGKIIGNFVHDNGQMGLGGGGNNILVEGNEIARNSFWSGVNPNWEGGGFKFAHTDGLIVRGNYSHDNNGNGMWTDIDNIHTLYENNVVVHNTMGGIVHEISYDAVIRNNTLIGNGHEDPRSWWWGNEIQIQNSSNVDVYGNRVDMTGGGNGIVLIQQNRPVNIPGGGTGQFGPHVTTGNNIHDNIIVDHDSEGFIGGVTDFNQASMLNGNTWSNNHYFMSDGGGRFQWGSSDNFAQFKAATHETGSISQSYPNTDDWLTGTPADSNPPPPADNSNQPPADNSNQPPADNSNQPPADNSNPPPADHSNPPPADNSNQPPADNSNQPPADNSNPPPADNSNQPPDPNLPMENLVLTGSRGSDHLTGGDGNDQLYGARGNDVLMGNAGNDGLRGGDGRDILMGAQGNDTINGNSGSDYLLLDGSMQDYTFAITKRGTTITDSAGQVDTVKNVEVFHFSDGTNYLVGKHGLVQTSDQNINQFLADSGVDQAHLGSVPTAEVQQQPVQPAPGNPGTGVTDPVVPHQACGIPSASTGAVAGTDTTPTSPGTIISHNTQQHGLFAGFVASNQPTGIFGQALNQTGHTQGVEKLLGDAALWNAVDAASNNPTHADNALADLKQQLHDAFDHNGGANLTVDELAAQLHLTHHE